MGQLYGDNKWTMISFGGTIIIHDPHASPFWTILDDGDMTCRKLRSQLHGALLPRPVLGEHRRRCKDAAPVQHPFWGHGEVVGWYTRHSIQILFFEWSQHSYCQESLSWSSFMMFYWLKSSKSQWTPLVSTTAEPGSRRAGVCLTVYPSTPLMSLQVPMKTVADTCTHRFHELHRWFWIAGPHRMTWLAGACWVYLILEIPVAHMISINYSAAAWFYHRSPKRKKERCLTIHVFSTKITQG